jgi:hypothetical protein
MFRLVIEKGDSLEVVLDTPNHEEIPSAIERLDPEWVIMSSPAKSGGRGSLNTYLNDYPSVRFILLSPDNRNIKLKWQASLEADLTNLSLQDFLHILAKDLQHT